MRDDRTLEVKEIARTKTSVSATRVRKALINHNKKSFETLTPVQIHPFYDELCDIVRS